MLQPPSPHLRWNSFKLLVQNLGVFRVSADRGTLNDAGANIELKAFINHFQKWTLTSLTIGPQVHETNTEFWVEAFKDLPPLPRVDNVTVIYHYPRPKAFNTDCWGYFDRILTRKDLFPVLKSLHIRSSCGAYQLIPRRWWSICGSLRSIRARGLGPRKSPALERYQWIDLPYVKDRC